MQRYIAALALLAATSVASAQFSDFGFAPSQGGGSSEANEYQNDDGTGENAIGLTNGGDLAWMTRYTVQAGEETITQIRIAFGSPTALNGRPVQGILWSDPNNDGSPADATVLASVNGVVAGATATTPNNAPTFVIFDIPDTTLAVGQNFFVGGFLTHLAGQFPALIDQGAPLPPAGVTWGAFGAAGTVNPNALPAPTDFFTLTANGLHGDWMVRADAVPVPEPTSLALLGVAGLLGLRRRGR